MTVIKADGQKKNVINNWIQCNVKNHTQYQKVTTLQRAHRSMFRVKKPCKDGLDRQAPLTGSGLCFTLRHGSVPGDRTDLYESNACFIQTEVLKNKSGRDCPQLRALQLSQGPELDFQNPHGSSQPSFKALFWPL